MKPRLTLIDLQCILSVFILYKPIAKNENDLEGIFIDNQIELARSKVELIIKEKKKNAKKK